MAKVVVFGGDTGVPLPYLPEKRFQRASKGKFVAAAVG
jgi:hypothetical protein